MEGKQRFFPVISLGNYINSRELESLIINGVDLTNSWVHSSNLSDKRINLLLNKNTGLHGIIPDRLQYLRIMLNVIRCAYGCMVRPHRK